MSVLYLALGLDIEIEHKRGRQADIVRLNVKEVLQTLSERIHKQSHRSQEQLDQSYDGTLPPEIESKINYTDELFVKPDEGDLITEGTSEEKLKEPKLLPRTLLAFEVLEQLGITKNKIAITEGKNEKNMLRQQSYRSFIIPSLNKMILVCDEEGNKTLIVHTLENLESIRKMKKSEWKHLIEEQLADTLIWCDPEAWKIRLMDFLTAERGSGVTKEEKEEKHKKEIKAPDKKDITEVEGAPEGWMTNLAISKNIQCDRKTVKKFAEKYRNDHPEWFKGYKNSQNRFCEHYSPELVVKIISKLTVFDKAPDGWIVTSALAKRLNLSPVTIKKIAKDAAKNNPKLIKQFRGSRGQICEYYHKKLVNKIADIAKTYQDAPDGWLTNNLLVNQLDSTYDAIVLIAEKYRNDHQEWFSCYKIPRGQVREHYSPQLVSKITEDFNDLKTAPSGWLTTYSLSKYLGISFNNARSKVEKYRNDYLEWFKNYKNSKGQVRTHYSPHLIKIIKEELDSFSQAPKGWLTKRSTVIALRSTYKTIKKIAEEYREIYPHWFKDYRTLDRHIREHYSPELIEIIGRKLKN